MHLFPPGTKVETNQAYFHSSKRKVKGTSVATTPPTPPDVTAVIWEIQSGKIIPHYQGNVVLMFSKDLQVQRKKQN